MPRSVSSGAAQAWDAEIERRAKELESRAVERVPWSKVRERLFRFEPPVHGDLARRPRGARAAGRFAGGLPARPGVSPSAAARTWFPDAIVNLGDDFWDTVNTLVDECPEAVFAVDSLP